MELQKAIESWKSCIDHEQFILDNCNCGCSMSIINRIKLYKDIVKSLELEIVTGKPHCIKCFKTTEDCMCNRTIKH